ncbi:MAG: hypothetical protein ACOZQL_15665 [Myxococcota bacterium]
MLPAERVVQKLAELLGPVAAQSTLNTFCKRTVGVKPESLTASQMQLVLPSLKPLLSVLVGAEKSEVLIAGLLKEFGS